MYIVYNIGISTSFIYNLLQIFAPFTSVSDSTQAVTCKQKIAASIINKIYNGGKEFL